MLTRRKENSKSRRRSPAIPLRPYARQLIAYWRDSLIDAERMEPSERDRGGKTKISLEFLKTGSCGSDAYARLDSARKRALAAQHSSRKNRSGDFGGPQIEVLISPLSFLKSSRGIAGVARVEPLWIPAIIDPSGRLKPPAAGRSPWVPRSLLEPLESDEFPAIGSVEALDDYPPFADTGADWPEYWRYCDRLFKKVTGSAIEEFRLSGYEAVPASQLVLDSGGSSAAALVRVFDQVLSGKRKPGSLIAFTADAAPARKPFSRRLSTLSRSAFLHSGQFGKAYSLSRSQRLAVHRFFETGEGQQLCITGPPGTGKTTCIQSIVASSWVQAARFKNTNPPVILVVGATNQSVINVIQSFGKAHTDDDILAQRWLPGISSYGTFCCSDHRAKSAGEFQLELRDGKGLSQLMLRAEYLRQAEKMFLRRFAEHTGQHLSLERAIARLRQQLNRELQALHKQILLLRNGTPAEWLRSIFGLLPRTDFETLLADVSQFDCSLRHRCFLLATHIWEGRWLLAAAEELARRGREGGAGEGFRGAIGDWRLRAHVTPAFVSTLQMAPRFFGKLEPHPRQPRAQAGSDSPAALDLIIFDEAGQIPPEYGAACAALARKAVVIGDPQQLPPHRTIPRHVDMANASRNGLLKMQDLKRWKELAAAGGLSSEGSMMHLAIHNSRFEEGSTKSVYLTEHRRSVPQIVGFCNDLAYAGRLIPMRKAVADHPFPPLGYADIKGKAERVGQSWRNTREVAAIKHWLQRQEAAITAFYGGRTLAETTAVITPFFAQARALEKSLLPDFPGMVIGTVNALQGAERDIVLFSSVYDRGHRGQYYFDCGVYLLNVAVSRAKDSFLVFGDCAIFDPLNVEQPSSYLARHLFARPENKIEPEQR